MRGGDVVSCVWRVQVVSTVALTDAAAVIIMNGSDAKLEVPLARAAAVGVLIQLMHGKSGVRPAVVETLAEALNTPNSPLLSSLSSSNPAMAIASALQGKIDLQSHEVSAITTVCCPRRPVYDFCACILCFLL